MKILILRKSVSMERRGFQVIFLSLIVFKRSLIINYLTEKFQARGHPLNRKNSIGIGEKMELGAAIKKLNTNWFQRIKSKHISSIKKGSLWVAANLAILLFRKKE